MRRARPPFSPWPPKATPANRARPGKGRPLPAPWNRARRRYRPFGGTLTQPTNPALHIGFTGHDRTAADTSLNLIYMNARYYMPGSGRFLSADTLIPDPADGQAFNRYAYVLGNPLRFTDPTGHCGADASKQDNKNCEEKRSEIERLSGGVFTFDYVQQWTLQEMLNLLYAVRQLLTGLGNDTALLRSLVGPGVITLALWGESGAGWSPRKRHIYLSPSSETRDGLAWSLAHEVGHAVMDAGWGHDRGIHVRYRRIL